ncbi:flagellar export chaperone FliS [Paenibacillus sp. IB182496]|uniref:Flagellar secretion chaperone FliS n=1 Tax=Paenibacillus sabuli TaxID=2772509 RepID=A0A927BUM5_9BACL|nr:flagellar export chaperone FliS [Paenibacillus sabuli]MBD2845824.1 flagellar export chaperone FliS [Paenibacillus sabuli]
MINNPYLKYQQSAVQTASPAQQLIMLYDGAIRFLRSALEAVETRNIESANANIQKAQAIIHEFVALLDFTYPVAKDLANIYEYMLHQLIQANLTKSMEPIQEVLNHMIDLRETWVQANKQSVGERSNMTHA